MKALIIRSLQTSPLIVFNPLLDYLAHPSTVKTLGMLSGTPLDNLKAPPELWLTFTNSHYYLYS